MRGPRETPLRRAGLALLAAACVGAGWTLGLHVPEVRLFGAEDPLARELARLGDGKLFERAHAAHQLGLRGDARAVEPLIRALDDPEAAVVINAAQSLGRLGDARAVGPLRRKLGEESPEVRRRAAEALESLGAGQE
ncbi:MAG: HEAT repeat domain-containing protein [Elusimicrobiota bacterium]